MIDYKVRQRIRQLRSQGMTYNEICDQLGQRFAKSTLSYVCKDVKLPEFFLEKQKNEHLKRLEVARVKAVQVNKELLENRYSKIKAKASQVVKHESTSDYEKIALSVLYLAEGAKYKSYRGLSVGSADPAILKLFISLLDKCYGVKTAQMRARVQHRADQDSEKLCNFWSTELKIPLDNFYLSYADRRTQGKPTEYTNYMGVCVISCRGADIQLELDAIARQYQEKLWCGRVDIEGH